VLGKAKAVWFTLGIIFLGALSVLLFRFLYDGRKTQRFEAKITSYFAVAGDEGAVIRAIRKNHRYVGNWQNTNIYVDEHTGQITTLSRFPDWYVVNPIDPKKPEAISSISEAEVRLAAMLRGFELASMKYEVLAKYDVKPEQSREVVADHRRVFVLLFMEKSDDQRFYQDGLRTGRIVLCASSGRALKFSLSLAPSPGVWDASEGEVQFESTAQSMWKPWSATYPIKRTEVVPMWVHRNPRPVDGKLEPLTSAYMVKGLDEEGEVRCILTLEAKSFEVLFNQCAVFSKSVNWNGRTWKVRELDGTSRAPLN
jgi:hypothetical protein